MEYASPSISRRSQELALSTTITWRILGSDLGVQEGIESVMEYASLSLS